MFPVKRKASAIFPGYEEEEHRYRAPSVKPKTFQPWRLLSPSRGILRVWTVVARGRAPVMSTNVFQDLQTSPLLF